MNSEISNLKSPISDALASGRIIQNPVGFENGYWAGAPGAFYAPDEKAWYLTYRLRRPRGVHPDRGGEARIARSMDLEHWEDQWSVTKDKFASASIERSALHKGPDGRWHYLVSFVDPSDGRWCVAEIQADTVQKLDAAKIKPIFKAQPLGLEGIKDPWIFESDGVFHLLLSVAVSTPQTNDDSHSTLDIFNTGQCLSATGLALSRDLEHWEWLGIVFAPGPGTWDAYCRRINSLLPIKNSFLAFYDGSASHAENYEERTGLAISSNLRNWHAITPATPAFTSPHASGSLRYLDAQLQVNESTTNDQNHVRDRQVLLFYESARADGAHDLRLAKVSLDSLMCCLSI
jgi:hypothetical protein